MTWVKLDDRFFDNPKIAALSDAAKVAYLEATCYCARELTDGFVPAQKAKAIAGKPRVVQELVPHLWEPGAGGYKVHDYLKYNPTREAVLSERAAAKRRMIGVRSAVRSPEQEGEQQGEVHPSPVTPIPEGDLDNPLPNPGSEDPPPRPPSLRLPRRAVVVGFEQAFGRLLSPTELELVRALEEEHPPERIEYALREAAALHKTTVRYVQRTCERVAIDGDTDGADRRKPAAPASAGAVAVGVSDVDRRRAFVAERGRPGGS